MIVGYLGFLGAGALAVAGMRGELPDPFATLGPTGTQAVFSSLVLIPVGGYFVALERGRGTLGKRRSGLLVRRLDGSAPPVPGLLLRTVVKLLPWEVAHWGVYRMVYHSSHLGSEPPASATIAVAASYILAGGYVLVVLLRQDRRGPHDLVAGTMVVTAP